jgi:hypothetical protein
MDRQQWVIKKSSTGAAKNATTPMSYKQVLLGFKQNLQTIK